MRTGLLSVSAREQSTGVEASVVVKPSYGLSDDDIARMLQESFAQRPTDMRARALREAQVEAERIVDATRSALAADGELLAPTSATRIDAAVAEACAVSRAGDDHRALAAGDRGAQRATDAIRRAAHGPQRRRALTGRSVERS